MAMADYGILGAPARQSDVLLDNWFGGQKPQMQSYSEPWYRALPNWLTDQIYGPNANAQQAAGVRHIVGPENPLNLPAQFSEGVDTARTGYQLGNSMMAGLGAFQAATALPLPGAKVAGQVAKQEAKGIRAYHGSPHDFDKFDISKIGTGEGAQAYGHGLYFAENEGVAKSYKTAGVSAAQSQAVVEDFNAAVKQYGGDLAKVRQHFESLRNSGAPLDQLIARSALEDFDGLARLGDRGGRMYEVNIKADPEHFLDWDKPLSQQPEKVRNSIAQAGFEPWHAVDVTGTKYGPMPKQDALAISRGKRPAGPMEDAYGHHVMELFGGTGLGKSRPDISSALQQAGIPGVKYLDNGSRAAGDGSRNYVVFDPATIEIIRKYGLLGMIGGGAAATNGGQQPGILGQ